MKPFKNRKEAGKILAKQLSSYANRQDTLVLGLPRGGVPIAYEIAHALSIPLDVFIVRKLGVPENKELAMGAIATPDIAVFNEKIIQDLDISRPAIAAVIQAEQKELERRELAYRGNRPFPKITNKMTILADDGIATGATVRAAILALRQHNPAKIILATPVAAKDTYEELVPLVDEFVCLLKPYYFYGVAAWYVNFPQTTDIEVRDLLL